MTLRELTTRHLFRGLYPSLTLEKCDATCCAAIPRVENKWMCELCGAIDGGGRFLIDCFDRLVCSLAFQCKGRDFELQRGSNGQR